ncbi:DUF2142 domain-containing protein [Patulibacter sp. NPDC049589]|uniref:DUF2142 domain-containing protein n=1 Tax=Patulibacter sp. NPDC049589 TaxID=3154731 RepID=UPI00342FA6E0
MRNGVARVPLAPVRASSQAHQLCLLNVGDGPVEVLGSGGVPALRITGAHQESGWSVLGAIVQRTMRANGAPARWIGLPGVVVLLTGSIGLALVLTTRAWGKDGWRPSRGTWVAVAAVAAMHGAAWSVLTPPFEVPDEWTHFQYADYVADHGELPNGRDRTALVAPDQALAMQALGANGIPGHPSFRPPWSGRSSTAIRSALADAPRSPVPDGSTSSTGQPPLYFAVAGAVDAIAPGNVLDRIAQVRLVGVLALAALALGAMALARRLVPGRPEWAVTAGLLAGLVPLVAFMAGGVTPDIPMLALATWTTSAALGFVESPVWRRGLVLGLLGVALVLVKLTALALAPGLVLLVLLAIGIAISRGWPAGSTGGMLGLAAGFVGPLVVYAVWCAVSDRSMIPGSLVSIARAETAPGTTTSGPMEFLSLTWQLYLPRMPWMDDLVQGFGLRDIWIDGFVGRYGWLDYGLPGWVGDVLPLFWLGLVVLGIRGLWILIRRRQRELPRLRQVKRTVVGVAFVLLLAGVLVTVARADYTAYITGNARFQQARYLMLAVPAAIALVVVAIRGTPVRARPYVAVTLVGVAALHTVASILATVGRYYV